MKGTIAGEEAKVRPGHVASSACHHLLTATITTTSGAEPTIWFVLHRLRFHDEVVHNHILGSSIGDEIRRGGWIKAVQSITAAMAATISRTASALRAQS